MHNEEEVIDVEEFHETLRKKSFLDLKRKYQRAKEENTKLDIKANNIGRANDALRQKLFERDQRRNEMARLLGFEDMDSAEANINSEDPWIPGGQASLSGARARILLLEDELAKHITASKEAHTMLKDADENLKQMSQRLDEANEDASRLREERDLARQEAERHAMDARAWRIEVQTTMPETLALIRELQQGKERHVASEVLPEDEKATITPGRSEHGSRSPFCELANTIYPAAVPSSLPAPAISPDAQHYKQQFELLQAQYSALLVTKEKISRKFREKLVAWKNFKDWLVKDNAHRGSKPEAQRRILRRRKVVKEASLSLDPQERDFGDHASFIVSNGPGRDLDMADLVVKRSTCGGNDGTIDFHRPPPPNTPPRALAVSEPRDSPATPSNPALIGESLTQPSSVLSLQCQSTAIIMQPSAKRLDGDNGKPPSQESLTQPSSLPSFSSILTCEELHVVKEAAQLEAIADDGHAGGDSVMREGRDVGEELTVKKPHKHVINPRIVPLQSDIDTPKDAETSRTTSTNLPGVKRLRVGRVLDTRATKLAILSQPRTPNPRAIRRSSTVLATDTPPRMSANSIVRHHSSPPDSPHMHRLNKGKRKAVEVEESDGHTSGSESDPFKTRSSRVRSNPTVVEMRKEKLARLKSLNNRSHKAYMAEYMQFKGRGRYSHAQLDPQKTVNGEFEIDPSKNGGLPFQYDAVVRDKTGRKRLEADDCECCRDYYEAIGPLPPRLQAPMWRSPSSDSSQHPVRPCRYEQNRTHDATMAASSLRAHSKAVDAHKRDISRHRHNWAPPTTPPDFWKIAFPDTQTVEDINRRANDMHASKFDRVEAEANTSHGRYRKRK